MQVPLNFPHSHSLSLAFDKPDQPSIFIYFHLPQHRTFCRPSPGKAHQRVKQRAAATASSSIFFHDRCYTRSNRRHPLAVDCCPYVTYFLTPLTVNASGGASSKALGSLDSGDFLDLDALIRENPDDDNDTSNPYSYREGEREREREREKAKSCLRAFMITKIILDANSHILLDQILREDEDAGILSLFFLRSSSLLFCLIIAPP